jgi:hypothetical protein
MIGLIIKIFWLGGLTIAMIGLFGLVIAHSFYGGAPSNAMMLLTFGGIFITLIGMLIAAVKL